MATAMLAFDEMTISKGCARCMAQYKASLVIVYVSCAEKVTMLPVSRLDCHNNSMLLQM